MVAAHVYRVQLYMAAALSNLANRLAEHDKSKYSDDELGLVIGKPALDAAEYMSEEELVIKSSIGEAIKSHYKSNSHHPEHFTVWECNGCFKTFAHTPASMHCDACMCEIFEQPKGVEGMSLFDLLEMLCDWKAASESSPNGSIMKSIEWGTERFKLSKQLALILQNTALEMGWGISDEAK